MSSLTQNWNTARIIRLIASIAVAVYGITTKDYIFLWLAGFLLLQSLFNLSWAECKTPLSKDRNSCYRQSLSYRQSYFLP